MYSCVQKFGSPSVSWLDQDGNGAYLAAAIVLTVLAVS
jgi:hypothetical protein